MKKYFLNKTCSLLIKYLKKGSLYKNYSMHTCFQPDDYPECFISYCWSNSHDAISKGSRKKENALGWGDPRKIKEFLSEKQIGCWLDVERVGGVCML